MCFILSNEDDDVYEESSDNFLESSTTVDGSRQVTKIVGEFEKWDGPLFGWERKVACVQHGSLLLYNAPSEVTGDSDDAIALTEAVFIPHDCDPCR